MYVDRYESPQALKWTRHIPGDKDLAQYRIPEATRDLHTATWKLATCLSPLRYALVPMRCVTSRSNRRSEDLEFMPPGVLGGMHIFLELLANVDYTVSIDIDTH